MSDLDLMLRFMLQLLVILIACKVIGILGRRYLGQTQVVMEMIAGVILGPSLIGGFWPEFQNFLFPTTTTYVIDGAEVTARHPSMSILYVVSQIGLVIYMFLVGLEFNVDHIRQRAKGAAAISVAGIVAPFALGVVLCLLTFRGFGLFREGIDLGTACLYFGAAMSITAFPTLARIIYDQGIAGTSLGTLTLGAGAIDDAAAWSLLAIVLAFAKGSWTYAAYAIGGGILFCVLVFAFVRPVLARMGQVVDRDGGLPQHLFMTVMILLFAGAYVTDAIGIYAVFGAFLIGVTMPRGKVAEEIRHRLESVTVGLFVPIFFIYSGLNTKVDLIDSPALWGLAALILLAAIAGKGLACTFAARAFGEEWRQSWAIGTLMNARGLMELIILNIGLQQGVITERLFTIMVLMAIVTTLMTSPIFKWIYSKHPLPTDQMTRQGAPA